MIDEQGWDVEKSRPHHIAVLAPAALDKGERVTIELAHHAHDRSALRTGWSRWTNLSNPFYWQVFSFVHTSVVFPEFSKRKGARRDRQELRSSFRNIKTSLNKMPSK